MRSNTWTIEVKDSIAGVRLVSARRGRSGKKLTGKDIPKYVLEYCEVSESPSGILDLPWKDIETMREETWHTSDMEWKKYNPVTKTRAFTCKIDPPDPSRSRTEPPVLPCMVTHMDGAHCGLTDWYPEIEAGITAALKGPRLSAWTTGWYASKKEIASGRITAYGDGKLHVEVSVSDDFDTPGEGHVELRLPARVERVQEAIAEAWALAEDNQKDNRCYVGFSIGKDGRWEETYILPQGDGNMMEQPPGDNYCEWGWQADSEIPKMVQRKIEKWINAWDGQPKVVIAGYTVRPWEEKT